MATIIDTKNFECSDCALMDIAEFVGPFIDDGGVKIHIKIQKVDEQRQHKDTARDILRKLVEEEESHYKKYGYDFNFYTGKYKWKNGFIHLTDGEALFLFRVLVMDYFNYAQRYYIYNMRKRFGNAFLSEIQIVNGDAA
jgi:hypothetical protein